MRCIIYIFLCVGLISPSTLLFSPESLFSGGKDIFLSSIPTTRVVRQTGAGILEIDVIGLPESCQLRSADIKELLKELRACMKKKSRSSTPRDEYVQYIATCGEDTKVALEECLPDKMKYFPQVILKIAQSSAKLLYDDKQEIERLIPCFGQLKTEKSRKHYNECVAKLEGRDKIPYSKTAFCEKFISVSRCFVKQINETCTVNSDLQKFSNDYMIAMEESCQ